MTIKPRITITYCTQCSWMLRAAWMGQELLSTFGADLGEVALIPGTGGIFEIHVNGDLIWERKRDGGFPEAKVLKQKVRDIVWPNAISATRTGIRPPGSPPAPSKARSLRAGQRTVSSPATSKARRARAGQTSE
jgi:selenoprotein W-related protein